MAEKYHNIPAGSQMTVCCNNKNGYVDRDGVYLFYRMRGKYCQGQPVLVFIHGDDSSSKVWACQQDFFCRTYLTIAIDMRGFGCSSKPPGPYTIEVHRDDLKFLLSELNILNYILIGWSTGGCVTLSYLVTYPNAASGAVLVSTASQIAKTPTYPWGRSLETQLEILMLIETNFPQYIQDSIVQAVPETCPSASIIREETALMIEATPRETILKQTTYNYLYNVTALLPTIQVPVLITVGGKDKVVDPNNSFYLRMNIPNSRLVEFPNAGHSLFLTFKGKFNQSVSAFLRQAIEKIPISCDICRKNIV